MGFYLLLLNEYVTENARDDETFVLMVAQFLEKSTIKNKPLISTLKIFPFFTSFSSQSCCNCALKVSSQVHLIWKVESLFLDDFVNHVYKFLIFFIAEIFNAYLTFLWFAQQLEQTSICRLDERCTLGSTPLACSLQSRWDTSKWQAQCSQKRRIHLFWHEL